MTALSRRATRSSARTASKKISYQSQVKSDDEEPDFAPNRAPKRSVVRDVEYQDASPPSSPDASLQEQHEEPPPKRRKSRPAKDKNATAQFHERLFGPAGANTIARQRQPCTPPARRHNVAYHRPLLLDDVSSRQSLLSWFDGVSSKRAMPWRKTWINPQHHSNPSELRDLLERRAYEVWISEIMLQQTRVAVVIDYWNRWMAKWPTIHDLAAASPDDVLSAWRGLGYYSRATRIHEAAKRVVQDPEMKGLLPAGAAELEAKVPGVGKYTGGAISAIVFGHAAPMVDGNVLRVLSRQLGLLGNVKTNKSVIDALWAAADGLVKAVAKDKPEGQESEETDETSSDRPGRWGQALMELGSTVCAPKPDCARCPISSTCRAYGEGKMLASDAGSLAKKSGNETAGAIDDIEDLCSLCEPLEEPSGLEADEKSEPETRPTTTTPLAKKGKQMSLSAFAFTGSSNAKSLPRTPKSAPDAKAMEVIVDHARKFPVKVIKKAVRTEETLVCVIRRDDGHYLIQKRPEKGLLAGLWEFPSHILESPKLASSAEARRKTATTFVSRQISEVVGRTPKGSGLQYVKELGSVPWLFSHIKLTMHVQFFTFSPEEKDGMDRAVTTLRWASSAEVERESMGSGMRKCWELVQESNY